MASRLPSAIPRRPTAPITNPSPSHTPLSYTPSRAATIIKRPRRPYTFTQLVQQTDGSTYTMRTTSPLALYKSNKDTRNHILWQPSDSSLRNVEVDEAGKLAAFRGRFGRGWDVEKTAAEPSPLDMLEAASEAEADGKKTPRREAGKEADLEETTRKEAPAPAEEDGHALSRLISGYMEQQESLKDEAKAKVKAPPAFKPKKK
ncbi:hypothetical protein F4804DRAFT_67603 [Jackrogersella minutella]|nr:hypothetical protein F4804DRAFT_67603 [Jackrogersella minutella]